MMQVMVAPERFHPFERRVPGVDGIVHAAIEEIPKHKTGPEHEYVIAYDEVLQAEQRRGDDQAGYGRHEETFFVAGKMMVVAMHDIDDLLRSFTFRYHMKGPAMHDILEKGPEEHTS